MQEKHTREHHEGGRSSQKYSRVHRSKFYNTKNNTTAKVFLSTAQRLSVSDALARHPTHGERHEKAVSGSSTPLLCSVQFLQYRTLLKYMYIVLIVLYETFRRPWVGVVFRVGSAMKGDIRNK